MAYNYYPNTYQAYPQYPSQPNAYPTQMNVGATQPTQNNGIILVQGEAGAKSYLVAPNQSVVLWDTESQTIYVKSADASGMPSIKTLDYTMRESAPNSKPISGETAFASKDDVDILKKEIEALKGKFEERESTKK
jgi:hypothetical protein